MILIERRMQKFWQGEFLLTTGMRRLANAAPELFFTAISPVASPNIHGSW